MKEKYATVTFNFPIEEIVSFLEDIISDYEMTDYGDPDSSNFLIDMHKDILALVKSVADNCDYIPFSDENNNLLN